MLPYYIAGESQDDGSYCGADFSTVALRCRGAFEEAMKSGLSRWQAGNASVTARANMTVSCAPQVKPASRDIFAAEESEHTRAGDAILCAIIRNEAIMEESGSSSLSVVEQTSGAVREGHGLRVQRSMYPRKALVYASRNLRKTVFLQLYKPRNDSRSSRSSHRREAAAEVAPPLRRSISKSEMHRRVTRHGPILSIPMGGRVLSTALHDDPNDATYREKTTRIAAWRHLTTMHFTTYVDFEKP